jgi:hypothetical protein
MKIVWCCLALRSILVEKMSKKGVALFYIMTNYSDTSTLTFLLSFKNVMEYSLPEAMIGERWQCVSFGYL